MKEVLTLAAQYLRMSTDHQHYPIQNQSDRIRRYAEDHGFVIAQTYTDAPKVESRSKIEFGERKSIPAIE
jgi:DNA invertase Pin-like site-specific DNA recombinase